MYRVLQPTRNQWEYLSSPTRIRPPLLDPLRNPYPICDGKGVPSTQCPCRLLESVYKLAPALSPNVHASGMSVRDLADGCAGGNEGVKPDGWWNAIVQDSGCHAERQRNVLRAIPRSPRWERL